MAIGQPVLLVAVATLGGAILAALLHLLNPRHLPAVYEALLTAARAVRPALCLVLMLSVLRGWL